ncbi:uncharacterized protein [Garra rufa]|uniref:uncharacterized protein n=3 Tax=Garra rufa TaxID=137080 RepID=UPI003CCE7DCA
MGSKGKPELRDDLQLWYYPPQPALTYNQGPAPDRFFCHALLLWMPYKLWRVKILCPNPACGRHQLTGGGLHKRARQVLDIDRMYSMVTETLICTKCRASHVSWSQTVLQQLDLGHRSEFRVILTRKYACDMRVIRLLRERSLGNSPTRVIKQLRENHSEEWLQRLARYTTQCVDFLNRPGVLPVKFQEPPQPTVVPSCKWLLTVYSQDILTRLDEIHARITSTYGSVLKMDSTKKITKKLAGTARGTGLWLTSVGNEFGQVLMSVLTAQEGAGLDMMVDGLVKRYQQAGVDPPAVLYVDCGCCTEVGETKLKTRFRGWPDLMIRLDIWHFMRRIALGCTTDAHQLYPIFMSRLSACIFEWDAADLSVLRKAKRALLISQGWPSLADEDVNKHLTRNELALHCRRRTRGEETTILLLERLFTELLSSKGNDSLGVPLLDQKRMEHIWSVQKKHVKCIQDPPGVVLYIETGSLTKGGVLLTTYRCARGSTSLESFHLHLNRFIPGTSANSLNFQIYLLEGLHRWNQDREAASLSAEPSALCSYTGELVHCVNSNYEKLFGKKVVPTFCSPACYTGELIGVQYLFQQTGQALQDMNPDSEQNAELIEDLSVEERDEDEGFCDISEDQTITDLEADLSPPSSTLALSGTSVLGSPSPSPVPDPTQGLSQSPTSPGPSGTAVSPVPSETSVSPLPSEPEDAGQKDDEEMAVDSQNVPGYQHVDRLAEYLVDLRGHTALSLTNQEANTIIALWQSLDDQDKQRVVYAARHQKRLLSGRFRVPKRPTQTPGVESTTRCVLGASSAPAQWPDCCRLVETIFIRLCTVHPSPKRKGKGALSRWSLILQDYRRIRQLVLGNSLVMEGTSLQLVEVNQNTLIQWHNNRQKKQELSVLLQGIQLPQSLPEAQEPLQAAKRLRTETEQPAEQHQYKLPESTAGQAKQRQGSSGRPPLRPKAPAQSPVSVTPSAPGASAQMLPNIVLSTGPSFQGVPMLQGLPVLQGLQVVQRLPMVQGMAMVQGIPFVQGMPIIPPTVVQAISSQPAAPTASPQTMPKRPYRRTVEANTCKKCGQFKTSATGHSQYRGRVYCPQTETVTKEQWLEEMRRTIPK